jgi:hypothetical protein
LSSARAKPADAITIRLAPKQRRKVIGGTPDA